MRIAVVLVANATQPVFLLSCICPRHGSRSSAAASPCHPSLRSSSSPGAHQLSVGASAPLPLRCIVSIVPLPIARRQHPGPGHCRWLQLGIQSPCHPSLHSSSSSSPGAHQLSVGHCHSAALSALFHCPLAVSSIPVRGIADGSGGHPGLLRLRLHATLLFAALGFHAPPSG